MMDQLFKTFEWLTRAYHFCGTDSNVSVDPLGGMLVGPLRSRLARRGRKGAKSNAMMRYFIIMPIIDASVVNT